MKISDFLFPRDLEVNPTSLRRVLFIGSCLAEAYVIDFRDRYKETRFDFILFNNAMDLPNIENSDLQTYDVQYIQIPLRSVLTDAATRVVEFSKHYPIETLMTLGKLNIDRMLEKALKYTQESGLLTFVSGFIAPQRRLSASLGSERSSHDISRIIADLNDYLAAKLSDINNAFFLDIEIIASSLGKSTFLDDALSFSLHGSLFYKDWHLQESSRIETMPAIEDLYPNKNDEFFQAVFRQLEVGYRTVQQLDSVKLVIFDADNTLWRGQIAEDYNSASRLHTDGWPLGVWDAINQLRWRGILVAIASKNDLHVVEANWDSVVNPPFIKLDDFVYKAIDWHPKADNIKALLDVTGLTAASALFVDDNPVERAAVQMALPTMRCIGSNPFETKRILLWSAETQRAHITEESKARQIMMKAQIDREAARASSTHQDFLASLSTNVFLSQLQDTKDQSFPRVFELINKTNQFNTTGKRWQYSDFDDHFSNGGVVYTFSVKDRFTSYGLVGVVVVKASVIIQFVMSCRVLGMNVERAALRDICERLFNDSDKTIRGLVIETDRNMPARNIFEVAGFTRTAETGWFALDSLITCPSVDDVATHW